MVAGLGIFALTAIALVAFAVFRDPSQAMPIPLALVLLAVGQIGAIAALWSRMSRLDRRIRDGSEAMTSVGDMVDGFSERLDAVEIRIANSPPGLLEEIAGQVRALRDGIAALAQGSSETPKAEAAAPEANPVPKGQSADRLDLLLQPVIELSTGSTAHYRAQLNLTGENGSVVAHDDLMAKAQQGGMREQLDAHALKLVAPVLRRLRVRNPGLRIFVPLGAPTLLSHAGTSRLTEILRQESDVTSGIVFEIDQETLGGLNNAGIASLAELARLGATMALTDVDAAGLDLGALRQLGVRFLSVNASAFDAGFGTSPAWRDFAQYARAMQFQLMSGSVVTAPQASAAAQITRFGFGPFFAPPRKVKTDAGVAPQQRGARAA